MRACICACIRPCVSAYVAHVLALVTQAVHVLLHRAAADQKGCYG